MHYFYAILTVAFSLFKQCYALSLPDWDYLVYSQRWPISACVEWEEKKVENFCNLPKDPNTWTVHGLWPTKTGTNGPNDCNSAIHFDPEQLQPLLNDLNNRWTNIEGKTKNFSFWSHEWDKHGTCASSLPQLNSVYNYFNKGLQLNIEYDLVKVLSHSNVIPNLNNYTIDDISTAIENQYNKTPQIQCIVDSKTKESLLSEIRLCLNKSFELIDCSSVGLELTNCSKKKPIKYFKNIPIDIAIPKVEVDIHLIDHKIISKDEMLQDFYLTY